MPPITPLRLWLLRFTYVLVFAGLAQHVWPTLIRHGHERALMPGVVLSMLTAVSLLALLGVAHPLRMLPVLLFELLWKLIWLTGIALRVPDGSMSAEMRETVSACLMGAIFPLVIPWRYVLNRYGWRER
jgi:hypothetical protein